MIGEMLGEFVSVVSRLRRTIDKVVVGVAPPQHAGGKLGNYI